MNSGRMQLRDRMVRDAIIEVLRGTFVLTGHAEPIPLVDAGLIGHLTVEDDRVRLELALPEKWSPFADSLAAEVKRRVQALPEVTLTEITVSRGQQGEDRDDGQAGEGHRHHSQAEREEP